MTINVYRIYDYSTGSWADDPEKYLVSVIATNESAQYVYHTGSTLDLEGRIEMLTEEYERNGNLPTTPEEWADLAIYNIGLGVSKVLVLEIPEDSPTQIIDVEDSEIEYLDSVLMPEMLKAREAREA
jgi:hypothetical protein